MKRGPNPKIFLAMAAGTVLVGGGLCYMQWGSLSDQQAANEKIKAEVKPTTEVQKMLADSQAKLTAMTTNLKHLEEGVPDFAYVPTLLSELEKWGKDNGIQVLGVRPMPKPVTAKDKDKTSGDRPRKKVYEELDIEVKGRGSYGDTMRFMTSLEKFPKIIAARTITMTPKNDANGTTQGLDLVIEIRAYVFPQPAGQTPPAPAKTASNEEGTSNG